ncbi:hypothetical protein V5O48_014548 [Marasmius crinis-equi]|uniref:Uncharacterized protein n=1 Tax=Marasmius crinis-equi TaxID=585013 RepID=A0ABR3EX00_9AGAR
MSFFDEIVPPRGQEVGRGGTADLESHAPTQTSSSSGSNTEEGSRRSSTSTIPDDSASTHDLSSSYSLHTPQAGRSLRRHGAFDRVTAEGFVSPSPQLPLRFASLKRRLEQEEDTPRTKQRIQEHTGKVCDNCELGDEDRAEVLRFSRLNERERSIALYGELVGLKSSIEAQKASKVADMLLDPKWKGQFSDAVAVCLLSPDITAYLKNTPEAVMKLVTAEPDLFHVPRELFNDQQKCLSDVRGNIKTKIFQSLKQKKSGRNQAPVGPTSINLLCKALAKPGMEIKGEMWARVAFLRFLARKFNQQQGKTLDGCPLEATQDPVAPEASSSASSVPKKYASNQYWNFVDDELKATRIRALQEGISAVGQRQKLSEFFQGILAQDLRDFPCQFAARPDHTPFKLVWQQTIPKAMAF